MTRRKKTGLKLLLVGLVFTGAQASASASRIDEVVNQAWWQVCEKLDGVENAGYMGPKLADNLMTKVVNSQAGHGVFDHPWCVG